MRLLQIDKCSEYYAIDDDYHYLLLFQGDNISAVRCYIF